MEFYSESSEMGMTMIQRGTVNGDEITGTWEIKELGFTGTWVAQAVPAARSLRRNSGEIADSDSEAAESVEINFDDFERRGVELNIPAGNFGLTLIQ